ncbi:MAG: hypothetical protein QY309_07700 [Cyclobacteriaceae bacterium]|nr:MAG: hypothetical protein QY309_07700 [Cyclobacteriaceae bacterium]
MDGLFIHGYEKIDNNDRTAHIHDRDIILIHEYPGKCNIKVLGKAAVTKAIIRRFKPKSDRSVILCGNADSYYKTLAKSLGIEVIVMREQKHSATKVQVEEKKKTTLKPVHDSNYENIVESINTKLPKKKFLPQVWSKFQGMTYGELARSYPHVLLKFINKRKELDIPAEVFEELIMIASTEISRQMES